MRVVFMGVLSVENGSQVRKDLVNFWIDLHFKALSFDLAHRILIAQYFELGDSRTMLQNSLLEVSFFHSGMHGEFELAAYFVD